MVLVPVRQAAQAQGNTSKDFVPPIVFQAAGPTADSIQSTVDAFRAALGDPNNGNNPGPLAKRSPRDQLGRRRPQRRTTTAPVTPFNVFLNTRGGQFTTPGTGLSQAPPSGGPQGGLAALFNNPTYGTIFSTFSPLRLFTPVGSNITDALFFIPGTNGSCPRQRSVASARSSQMLTSRMGADLRTKRGNRGASTLMEYFDADGKLLFSSFVPASPGDGSLSFFGIVFDDARIARVRITTGNVAPGPDDDGQHDIVMMDDFIYGEPQPLLINGAPLVSRTETEFGEIPSGSLSWHGSRHKDPRTMALTCRWSNRGSSSWLSISKPRNRSA